MFKNKLEIHILELDKNNKLVINQKDKKVEPDMREGHITQMLQTHLPDTLQILFVSENPQ